jgi:AcrR family transcriptional regulator
MPEAHRVRPPRRRLGEAERREQIIRGCVQTVARYGYAAASLARIADAAGVSKGLISHYFGDRETLMQDTAIATVDYLRDELVAAIDTTAPVPDVIRAALHRLSRIRQTHGPELRAINQIASNLRRPDGDAQLDLTAYEGNYQAQQRLFQRGQQDGSLRAFDTRVMAVTYQGAIDTMIAYLDAHPDADPDHYAAALADLLIAAIQN